MCAYPGREERAGGSEGDGAGDGIVTLRQMAAATLGPWGASAVSVVYLFIAFSLLVAYDSKVGDIMGSWVEGVSPLAAAAAFSGAMASIIAAGMALLEKGKGHREKREK
jgi:amino acid permease